MVKKCLFLAGGYGTRFLPATKSLPKEMLPILDKPLIQYCVEEAVDAGMDEIGFVTARTKRAIEDHFDANVELESHLRGSSRAADLAKLQGLIERCEFAYTRQSEMLGTGHAVLCGRLLMGGEAFAVVLPDDLCLNPNQGVLQQLANVYAKYQCCVVAVQKVPQSKTERYGIIDATEQPDGTFLVNDLVEKPNPEDAPSSYGVVGRYILVPEIFEVLARTQPGHSGEIQLTDALSTLAKMERVVACAFEGVRFDCGSIDGFVEATNYCYRQRNNA